MKITNQQIIDALNALPVLDSCKLTVKGAFAMRKNRATLMAEAKDINETHAEIFKKHFGNLQHADDKHPKWPDFRREVNELLAVTVDIEPQPIRISDVLDGSAGLIKALDDLSWLIEEGA